jgi:DNA repair exonuclease SbcCD nuclease subunit
MGRTGEMMSYKIGFISDIHYGCKNNSEKYLDIIDEFFYKTLSKIIKEQKITDMRILGDLFDNRNNINVRTLNSVLAMFRWYQKEMPHVRWTILVGNHDQYYHNRIDVNSIEALREHVNVTIIDKVTEEKINGKNIITFPWLSAEGEAEVKFKQACKGDVKYDLCLGHFEIKGFEMQRGFPSEHGVEQGTFKNFKRVFSGHFHIRNTSLDQKISYLGCPYQLTWGDYGDDKGVHVYDVDTNETTFFKNNDSPQFVKVSIEDFVNKDIPKLKLAKGNFVKLVIEKKVNESTLIKLIQKLESLGPIKLEIDNQVVEEIAETEEAKKLLSQYQHSVGKATDAVSFMNEYVSGVLVEEDGIDKEELKTILGDLYQISIKEDNG